MALEPLGLDLAGRHLASQNDLKRALAESDLRHLGRIRFKGGVKKIIEAVDLPVELFLKGDHL
jgi:hypothetical protein